MRSKIKLEPRTLELAQSAKDFLKVPRTRRELAEYLGVSKQSARNITDNHESIVQVQVPITTRSLHYVWRDEESNPDSSQVSIWAGLLR